MTPLTLHNIARLITQRTGICIREQDYSNLTRKLTQRQQALGLRDLESYYNCLMGIPPVPSSSKTWFKNPFSVAQEWQQLVSLVTVGESYFFRDRNQLKLLQTILIPQLMERQQNSFSQVKPQLRLWSAGCSTGEEPYSLAILLSEIIDLAQWDLLIIGTDICEASLAKARSGIFSSWSFRQFDPVLKEKYFRPHAEGWIIDSKIRQSVTFQQNNLLCDPYPIPGSYLWDIDLILCRNVFIYFESTAIDQVLTKFANTLKLQGCLITGHAELQGHGLQQFKAISFPESVVYWRNLNPSPPPAVPSPLFPSPTVPNPPQSVSWIAPGVALPLPPRYAPSPPRFTPPITARPMVPNSTPPPSSLSTDQITVLQEAKALLRQQNYQQVATTLQQFFASLDRSLDRQQRLEAYLLLAQAQANLGQSNAARQACQDALQIDPCSVLAYHLLAQLAEEIGDLEGAKVFLKRVIYLDPDAVMAYFNLSLIYEQEHSLDRARKVQTTAWDLVKRLPPETIVDLEHHRTAQDLQLFLERKMSLS
ncbi:CheR family methyltransferase [Prochlorothrix hollandica]|uniref:CheR family methyltransferase n=1 Tax=Prochlorothrix hollandica TaxID=1223 RepID=UPI0009D9A1E7|nr:protein-glutamate O-methyltransferase CheR [Prochlorothrix hollandica]